MRCSPIQISDVLILDLPFLQHLQRLKKEIVKIVSLSATILSYLVLQYKLMAKCKTWTGLMDLRTDGLAHDTDIAELETPCHVLHYKVYLCPDFSCMYAHLAVCHT